MTHSGTQEAELADVSALAKALDDRLHEHELRLRATFSAVPPLFTTKSLARHFGCGESTIRAWVKEGCLPRPVKIGGLIRWRKEAIDRWLEEREATAG